MDPDKPPIDERKVLRELEELTPGRLGWVVVGLVMAVLVLWAATQAGGG